jgi:hypothetical protein
MLGALEAAEREIPDFFALTDRPVNRLLVQFTDWELFGRSDVTPKIAQALEAGVNMLSVVPRSYGRHSNLPAILSDCRVQRGSSTVLKYDPMFPGQVWETAAQTMQRAAR